MSICATLSAFVLAALTARVPGGDLRVLAGGPPARPGQLLGICLSSWGDDLELHCRVEAASLERYDLLCPCGAVRPLRREGQTFQGNTVEAEEAGTYQGVACRRDGPGRWQGAKALLVVGTPGTQAVVPVGLPLEVVPVAAPAEWQAGKDQRFLVLYRGQPLAGASLLVRGLRSGRTPGWCHRAETDRDGIATVPAARAGQWVLRARARPQAADAPEYTATLSLFVRP